MTGEKLTAFFVQSRPRGNVSFENSLTLRVISDSVARNVTYFLVSENDLELILDQPVRKRKNQDEISSPLSALVF
jgi:hypothetical protein